MAVKWIFRRFMALQVYMYRRSGGKSGKQRVIPVMYIRDGSNYVVTASNNGADKYPAWFLNLKANPRVTIEADDQRRSAIAHQASPEDQIRLWPRLTEKAPFFEGYRKKAKRDISMVILEAAEGSQPVN